MNRTEMVRIIGREMRAQSSGNCDIDPDLVLSIIEAAGMLPPTIPAKTFYPSPDYIGGSMCIMRCSCEDCDPNFPVNKWEDIEKALITERKLIKNKVMTAQLIERARIEFNKRRNDEKKNN